MVHNKFEILNPKHETNPNIKFSNVRNEIEFNYDLEDLDFEI